jgi:NAD(P)H-hydrate epimerase
VHFVEGELGQLELALSASDVVVDALFGTGLTRPLEGIHRQVVTLINDCGSRVVALDVPSGIDANTGAELGDAVRADITVTFGHYKCGLFQGAALTHAGELSVAPLGIFDAAILHRVGVAATVIEPAQVAEALAPRPPDSHKYRAGSVLIVAGSPGKVGAALLGAEAALRAGAGIATIASWPDVAARMQGLVPEVMTAELYPADLDGSLDEALRKRDAVAIGPGLGLDEHARRVSERVVLEWSGPVVVDADALSHFAGRPEILRRAAGPRLLTPHSGELARLLGVGSQQIEADRFAAARRACDATGCAVLLKGPVTLVVGEGGARTSLCTSGSALLGTAGAGDVLTGIAAAFCCHASVYQAGCAAAFVHGAAADAWSERVGADRGMLASDIGKNLGAVLAAVMG